MCSAEQDINLMTNFKLGLGEFFRGVLKGSVLNFVHFFNEHFSSCIQMKI